MEHLNTFFAITFSNLNLFSFMLGMFYTLSNVTLRNQKYLWTQLLLYVASVGLYFFIKSEMK